MNNRLLILIAFIFSLIVLNCEGPQGEIGPTGIAGEDGIQGPPGLDGNSDKQIRIDLNVNGGSGANDTSWFYSEVYNCVLKFNPYNYTGVDSVLLVACMNTYETPNKIIMELYNVTDNEPIHNSQIETNSTNVTWCISNNIFSSFPNKEITVGYRLKTSVSGLTGGMIRSYLLLYRK
jgi:hypothetical protein